VVASLAHYCRDGAVWEGGGLVRRLSDTDAYTDWWGIKQELPILTQKLTRLMCI
jgi:hypothetical protein